ncbi:MAG: type I glutamate--ammonia ligase, partial [Nitrospirae bacterium RIFCSPLOWO2_02_42_7]
SSIRGWQAIHHSDMLVIPDPDTALMDPFTEHPTLTMICNIQDPITREHYSRDPRYVAQKAEAYLKSTRIADTCYMGPEAEFFVFDDIRYEQNEHCGYYFIDSAEGQWNTGRMENPNLGYKPRYKEGYFPVPPMDTMQDLRSEMVLAMQKCGIEIEAQHHEVATAGQNEIDMKFDSLTRVADKLLIYKYVVKMVARMHNKTATFMPKPLFGDNGSGMHTHQSLWKNGKPLFAGNEYAGVSQTALYYIGGILKHAHALAALTSPTTNSYRRLVPGFEAPVNLAYSSRNRSASVRIPMYSASPKAKRIEVRFPDASCNPYLAFSAMLMAGLDGVENKIDPGAPLDKDIYDMKPEELTEIPSLPGSLDEALSHLENDKDFLLKGGVFTEDVIETWINYKRAKEVDAIRLRPHPYEFNLYFDI